MSFDIDHPSKKGQRLRFGSLDGPEAGVYTRGRLSGGQNIIHLPDYWRELVDAETITVHLTSIGANQNLLVEEVKWGSQVLIRSESGTQIDCYYLVHGARKDVETLVTEYSQEIPVAKTLKKSKLIAG